MSRVGAVVSAYYCAPFLKGRLDNLAAQTLAEAPGALELVVVCQENSEEQRITEKWRDDRWFHGLEGPDVKICLTKDVPSVYAAWNYGIGNVLADYVTNANADDRLDPNALEVLAAALDEHEHSAVAFGNHRIVRGVDGPQVGTFSARGTQYYDLLRQCFVGPFPMWRGDLHQRYGWFDEDLLIAGDYDFWLRLAKAGEHLLHVDQIVGDYASRDQGRENREPVRTVWETARVLARYR